MLYPTAGSRLFIADYPVDQDGTIPAGGWVEIGETEAIGMLGSEWDVERADIANRDNEVVEMAIKGVERRPEMPIILGNDPTDPGQLLLWTAARSRDSYPFRLVFPDGVTARSWFALVVRIGEVFDTANAVMKLQADLKPTSPIRREA
jgi:hypothetical protein